MAPSLSDLFAEGEILASRGPLDRPASGIVMDSRRVVPGNVFFALPGLRTDGSTHVAEALSRGAVAVVTNTPPASAPAKVTPIPARRWPAPRAACTARPTAICGSSALPAPTAKRPSPT
jgi:UDP-N-acetylmuramyl pentapeptide synthase